MPRSRGWWVVLVGDCKQPALVQLERKSHLGLVAGGGDRDAREHAALLAARHAECGAQVGAQPHARARQRRVQRHVHGRAALARVVLVDHG